MLKLALRVLVRILLTLTLIASISGCKPEGDSKDDLPKDIPPPSSPDPEASIKDCDKHIVTLIKESSPNQEFSSIQEAIDSSEPESTIVVGMGYWPEIIKIKQKSDLSIQSFCHSRVDAFVIEQSDKVLVSGFDIVPNKEDIDGIRLKGSGRHGNTNITLENNDIHSSLEESGIQIDKKNRNVLISNNDIHHHHKHGIEIKAKKRESNYILKNNRIYKNKRSGVVMDGPTELSFEKNNILQNGLKKSKLHSDGYGIRVKGKDPHSRKDVLLTDNIIAYNNGKPSKKPKKHHKHKHHHKYWKWLWSWFDDHHKKGKDKYDKDDDDDKHHKYGKKKDSKGKHKGKKYGHKKTQQTYK